MIRRSDPKKLLREMIERRNKNYSHTPVYLTTFYREGVQLKNKFKTCRKLCLRFIRHPHILCTGSGEAVEDESAK